MLNRLMLKVEPELVRFYHRVMEPPAPNLRGDRHIEYSWIVANMSQGPGKALDFGTGPAWSWMGLLAARKGFQVTAVDIQPADWPYIHPGFNFVQGDILELNFPPECFDLIINCSTVEHVGLAGHYNGSKPRENGDLEAMRLLRNILKQRKHMLMTIPVGQDHVFAPLHRVYGRNRLALLLQGWESLEEEYWIKNGLNRWVCVGKDQALGAETSERCYGLGLFVLRRPE